MSKKADKTRAPGTSESTVGVVRRYYEAIARGDIPAVLDLLDLLDPEVEWRAPESLPWGGTYRGHDGFREFFANVMAQPAEFRPELLEYLEAGQPTEFRREVGEYLDAGSRVVTLLRQQARPKGGGAEYDVPEVWIWRVRDGKIVEFEGYFDTSTVLRTLHLEPRN